MLKESKKKGKAKKRKRKNNWLLSCFQGWRDRYPGGWDVKLVVGLGNPGSEYRDTRHNAGFMVMDELARRFRIARQDYRYEAVLARTRIQGETVLLAKPLTFMNLSGRAVSSLVNKFKINGEELLVIYDDMDLETGRIRLRARGGAGGHRGMNSIIERLGTGEFHRLRVGIGHPPEGIRVTDYVLSPFAPEEKDITARAVQRAADAAEMWIREGIVKAMDSYN
jgi:PTH1 family peptidyl-tRNA hydrolase